MAKVILKNLKKVYPYSGDEQKKRKKGEEPAEKKHNLQMPNRR